MIHQDQAFSMRRGVPRTLRNIDRCMSHSMALYEMIFETLTDLIAVLTMGWQVGKEGGGMGWPWPHAMQVHQSADAGR